MEQYEIVRGSQTDAGVKADNIMYYNKTEKVRGQQTGVDVK